METHSARSEVFTAAILKMAALSVVVIALGDGGCKHLRNVGKLLANYKAL
jgi:hypothetical protein